MSCTSRFTGLVLNTSGKARGEIDFTTDANNLNIKDFVSSRGDNQFIQSPLRDRNAGDGDSVYARWDFYTNGGYCYLSGIGVDASTTGGGFTISKGCSSGWHSYDDDLESKHIGSTSWWFMTRYEYTDPRSNTMRATIRVCQDEAWTYDDCSGSRTVGISY